MNDHMNKTMLEVLNKVNNLSEEELNDNIKKYFGEEYLIQEETLSKLYPFQFYVTNVLGTLQLPIIFDSIEQD